MLYANIAQRSELEETCGSLYIPDTRNYIIFELCYANSLKCSDTNVIMSITC